MDDASLLTSLQSEFTLRGFDLFATFPAGAYNEHKMITKPELLIPALDGQTLACVIGNTRGLWDAFIRHLKSPEGAAHLAHPDTLDVYTQFVVERVLTIVAPNEEVNVVYAFETVDEHGRCCSVNTVGHVSGLAYFDAEVTKFSIHPTFGPWFAYRAILTFNRRKFSTTLPNVKSPLVSPCERVVLEHVAALQAEVSALWGKVSERESWDGLMRASEAFTIGERWKYCPSQLLYHYSPQVSERKAILQRDVA